MAPRKIDLYAQHKTEYVAPKTPALVTIAPARYLSIDGQGAPGGARFTAAIGKLEAQWFVDVDVTSKRRDDWRWKLLIRTPIFVTGADLAQVGRTELRSAGDRGPQFGPRYVLITISSAKNQLSSPLPGCQSGSRP
jgi:hypothetical protein